MVLVDNSLCLYTVSRLCAVPEVKVNRSKTSAEILTVCLAVNFQWGYRGRYINEGVFKGFLTHRDTVFRATRGFPAKHIPYTISAGFQLQGYYNPQNDVLLGTQQKDLKWRVLCVEIK